MAEPRATRSDDVATNYIGQKVVPPSEQEVVETRQQKPVRKRRKVRTLAALVAICPSAAIVWIALCDFAAVRRSSVVTPTRQDIADASGINRVATISRALTALVSAGWIDRCHVPILHTTSRSSRAPTTPSPPG